jgi:hypothetical protein
MVSIRVVSAMVRMKPAPKAAAGLSVPRGTGKGFLDSADAGGGGEA